MAMEIGKQAVNKQLDRDHAGTTEKGSRICRQEGNKHC